MLIVIGMLLLALISCLVWISNLLDWHESFIRYFDTWASGRLTRQEILDAVRGMKK